MWCAGCAVASAVRGVVVDVDGGSARGEKQPTVDNTLLLCSVTTNPFYLIHNKQKRLLLEPQLKMCAFLCGHEGDPMIGCISPRFDATNMSTCCSPRFIVIYVGYIT